MKFKNTIENILSKRLLSQCNIPPQLFFTFFIITSLKVTPAGSAFYYLFTLIYMGSLYFNFNCFYGFSAIYSGVSGYFSIPGVIMGIIGSNQKWKLYLFCFISFYCLLINYLYQSWMYLIWSSLFIAIQTYNKFIFKTIDDNRLYFIGFSTIFCYSLLNYIILIYTNDNNKISLLIIPLTIKISSMIFDLQLQKLKYYKIQQLKTSQKCYHYITLLESSFENPFYKYQIISNHQQNCNSCECCFYKNVNQVSKQQFVEQIYRWLLSCPTLYNHQYLINKYIQRLINNKSICKASILLKKNEIKSHNYFNWIYRLRNTYLLNDIIDYQEKIKLQKNYYEEVINYDYNYFEMANQITQILQQKIILWRECGNNQPKFHQLKSTNNFIIDKIQKLHLHYCIKIRHNEDNIRVFKGSVLYAMYLLATTNYRTQAEGILKNINKQMEKTKYLQVNKQSYAIKVRIQQKFSTKLNKKKYILLIDSISNSCCELINRNRNFLLNKPLDILIPNIYHHKHQQKIMAMFQTINNYNMMFIGKTRIIPIVTKNKRLIEVKICVKLCLTNLNQIGLMALIQSINDNQQVYLTDFQQIKNNIYNQNIQTIIKNDEFQRLIQQLRQQWQDKHIISNKKIQIINVKNESYYIQVSSPYQTSFKPNQLPPIHIKVAGEESIKNNENIKVSKNKQINQCVKKIQNIFQVAQTQSQISNTSKQSSPMNFLLSFVQSKSISFFNYFILTILIIIGFSLILTTISYSAFNLPWDSSIDKENPYSFLKSLIKLDQSIAGIINKQYNFVILFSMRGNTAVPGFINSYTSQYINQKTQLQYVMSPPSIINELANKYLSKQINVFNPNALNGYNNQNLTLLNILSNYVVDVLRLANTLQYKGSLIEMSYLQSVHDELNNLIVQIKQFINKTINDLQVYNIIILTIFSVVIVCLNIPIYIMNKKNKLKIQQIYQIFVSIESVCILKEINILMNVLIIIKQSINSVNSIQIHSLKNVVNSYSKSQTESVLKDQVMQQNMNQQEVLIQLRKREGELIIDQNLSERKQKIIQSILYCIILLFLLYVVTMISLKIYEISIIDLQANQVIRLRQQYRKQYLSLVNSRIYLQNPDATFQGVKVQSWLKQTLIFNQNNYKEIILDGNLYKCPPDSVRTSTAPFCNLLSVSQLIISGIADNYMRQAYYAKKLNLSSLKEAKLNIVFTQALFIVKSGLNQQRASNMLASVIDKQIANIQILKNIYISSIIYAFISFIVTIIIIKRKINNYCKELLLMSYLNPQIIRKHKRVESFIGKLAKSSI